MASEIKSCSKLLDYPPIFDGNVDPNNSRIYNGKVFHIIVRWNLPKKEQNLASYLQVVVLEDALEFPDSHVYNLQVSSEGDSKVILERLNGLTAFVEEDGIIALLQDPDNFVGDTEAERSHTQTELLRPWLQMQAASKRALHDLACGRAAQAKTTGAFIAALDLFGRRGVSERGEEKKEDASVSPPLMQKPAWCALL